MTKILILALLLLSFPAWAATTKPLTMATSAEIAAIVTPKLNQVIYNITTSQLEQWNGTTWVISGGGGGGGTPGGSNNQVQYNSSGAFAGDANFTYNGSQVSMNVVDAYGGFHVLGRSGGEASFALQPDNVSNGSSGQWIFYTNGSGLASQADFAMYNSALSSPALILQAATGYVGIGTNNPSTPLQVNGAVKTTQLQIQPASDSAFSAVMRNASGNGVAVFRTEAAMPDATTAQFILSDSNANPSEPWGLATYAGTTTASMLFETGNASGGNSGGMVLRLGTATATRGQLQIIDGSEGTIGYCWISTDTAGSGHWAPCSGGSSANTTMSNLSGPTAANVSILPGVTGTIDLGSGSNVWRALYSSLVYDGSAALAIQVNGRQLRNPSNATMLDWSGTNVDFGTQRIINVADPTNPTDVATKNYVDTNAGYTPATPANWAGSPPTTVQQALDRLAAVVSNSGASPIP